LSIDLRTSRAVFLELISKFFALGKQSASMVKAQWRPDTNARTSFEGTP
jgi:hypothetical protein